MSLVIFYKRRKNGKVSVLHTIGSTPPQFDDTICAGNEKQENAYVKLLAGDLCNHTHDGGPEVLPEPTHSETACSPDGSVCHCKDYSDEVHEYIELTPTVINVRPATGKNIAYTNRVYCEDD